MAALVEGPHEVEVERIVLPGPAGPVDAIHARPLGLPISGVVVHPDILGIRGLFDDLARRLATHGFAVCAPEPFWAFDEAARADLDAPARLGLVADLHDEQQLGVLEAAADHLVVADDVHGVAILGFCMGGMYALKAAGSGRFDRAISCYGMVRVPEGWRGAHLGEPLDALTGACPVLAVFGGVDPWTPSADVAALHDALAAVPGSEVVVYPEADHGFVHDPDRPAHRAEDAADVWSRVLRFLGG